MAEEGTDILQEYVQAVLQGARHLGGTHEVGDKTLFINHVLPHYHGILLHLGNVDEEFLVNVLLVIDLLGVLGNLLGQELDHIGIQVHTLIQDAGKNAEAGRILLGIHLQAALKFRKRAQGHFPERSEGIVHNDERHSLHHVFLRSRG